MKIETTLREAAQQALKAYDQHYPLAVVMEDLRAVLAKDALQRLTDVQQEIEAVLAQFEKEPYAEQSRRVWQETQGRMRICPVTGGVGIGTPPPQQQAEPVTCTWTPEDDDTGTYSSACGELWSFIDGGWKDNRVNFCHGCGGKVVEAKLKETR